jgi:hypothetical protein
MENGFSLFKFQESNDETSNDPTYGAEYPNPGELSSGDLSFG